MVHTYLPKCKFIGSIVSNILNTIHIHVMQFYKHTRSGVDNSRERERDARDKSASAFIVTFHLKSMGYCYCYWLDCCQWSFS